jgi:hypothetical protein
VLASLRHPDIEFITNSLASVLRASSEEQIRLMSKSCIPSIAWFSGFSYLAVFYFASKIMEKVST